VLRIDATIIYISDKHYTGCATTTQRTTEGEPRRRDVQMGFARIQAQLDSSSSALIE